MYIKKIQVQNFRNYEKQEVELDKKINIFYGNNAQGKTNFLVHLVNHLELQKKKK